MHGVDNYKNAIESVSKAFPDMHYEVEMMIAEGDLVCTCLRSSATHKGEFMGIAPTGNKYTWREVAISCYEDGKIAEEWGYVVRPGLLDQVKENADGK
jgi:predicted ester cyclase